MMNDKQLLELAAKAVGLSDLCQWDADAECIKYPYKSDLTDGHLWNPLSDDGDALRLAVKLCIDILHRFVGGQRVEALAPCGALKVEFCNSQTRQEATRLVIVWAAADIGQSMASANQPTPAA